MTQNILEGESARGREGPDGGGEGSAAAVHLRVEYVRDAVLSKLEAARTSARSAKETAAHRVRTWGAMAHRLGEHLRIEDQHYVADKVGAVGRELDDVAAYIRAAEIGTVVRDGERIARDNPVLVFGGALILGLAAGRFAKGILMVDAESPAERARIARPQQVQAATAAVADHPVRTAERDRGSGAPRRTPMQRGAAR